MLRNYYINDLTLLLLAFLYVSASLSSTKPLQDIILASLAFLNIVLFKPIKYKYILLFILALLPALLALFIANLTFSKINLISYSNHSTISTINITTPLPRSHSIPHSSFYSLHKQLTPYILVSLKDATNGITIVTHMLALSICSFIFIIHIDFKKVIICAMKKLHLPVKLGYPFLTVYNSIEFLNLEIRRLKNTYKLRFKKSINPLRLIYPLLVSAARYASICGLSLEVRNLLPNKTFITHCPRWRFNDSLVLTINLLLIIVSYIIS